MKRLVFKKWVEYLVMLNLSVGFVIVGAFKWQTITPYIIGLIMMLVSIILLANFGRDE